MVQTRHGWIITRLDHWWNALPWNQPEILCLCLQWNWMPSDKPIIHQTTMAKWLCPGRKGLSRYKYILKLRQNGRHFPDDIFKCIYLNENVWVLIKISLKFISKGPINIIPALIQIMVWRCPGNKPLSEPMMVSLLTHVCVTRPQWVSWMTFQGSLFVLCY